MTSPLTLDDFTRAAGYDFALDPFQVEAIEALRADESVLVAAPTGSGKTIVAEYAVAAALAGEGRAFYTTPIKALSNQKYRDLRRRHGADAVGLLTGDNAVNGSAPVVVMTTEVLRNMIYARSNALTDLHYVVLDEVHYLQDAYRGPVWEEVIIHLDRAVRLVCLSATVSNADDLATWISSVRGPTATVVETRRPVELENLYLVGDRVGERLHLIPTLVDGRPNREGQRFDADLRRPGKGRPRRRWVTPRRVETVELLDDRSMLPAIYFIFSRAACDDAAKATLDAGLRLTSDDERRQIREIVAHRTRELSDADLDLLAFDQFSACLDAGIAAHHAGMVPPFKEAVELCFTEGLVKVVYATETLALGINMPARTVVIEKLTKYNGETHEFLRPAQYTQITGRAGRRGIDEHGYALVLWSPFVTFDQIASLAASRSFELRSAFRPTYNMAANLVRRYDADAAHRLLAASFAQFQANRDVERLDARVAKLRDTLADLRPDDTRRRERVERELADLRRRIRLRTESLVVRFDHILQVLEAWGHLDGWGLTERGELLVRIFHESDLLVAEAMSSALFDGLEPSSLAGLVSCLTYEHRSPTPPPDPWFPSRDLRRRFAELELLAQELREAEEHHELPLTRLPDPTFLPLAHAWAAGDDLHEVLEDDDELTGGDFVRNTRQLIDLLRQLGETAPVADTREAARSAAEAIARGVVAASAMLVDEEGEPLALDGDTDDEGTGSADPQG